MNITTEQNITLIAPTSTGGNGLAELATAYDQMVELGYGQGSNLLFSRHIAVEKVLAEGGPSLTDIELLINGLSSLLLHSHSLVGIGEFTNATDTLPFVSTARAAGIPVFRFRHGKFMLLANNERERQAADTVRVVDPDGEELEQLRLDEALGVMEVGHVE